MDGVTQVPSGERSGYICKGVEVEKEIIVSIEEVENYKRGNGSKEWMQYEGYLVHTNKQKIELLINSDQSCCEDFGYFWVNDDWEQFIGAEVYGVDVVDTCLNKDKLVDCSDGDMMFVNIETSRGTLQFTAYNAHNGYYGHRALVASTQIEEDMVL